MKIENLKRTTDIAKEIKKLSEKKKSINIYLNGDSYSLKSQNPDVNVEVRVKSGNSSTVFSIDKETAMRFLTMEVAMTQMKIDQLENEFESEDVKRWFQLLVGVDESPEDSAQEFVNEMRED